MTEGIPYQETFHELYGLYCFIEFLLFVLWKNQIKN